VIPFDGASAFGKVVGVLFGSALLAVPYVGWKLMIPAAIASYFALVFFNRLEARDRRDFKPRKIKRPR
jgi:hypothetical protein